MPVIPALGRLRQEDQEFEAIPGYIARPCLKTTTKLQLDILSPQSEWLLLKKQKLTNASKDVEKTKFSYTLLW
jgi:hypothetical protein